MKTKRFALWALVVGLIVSAGAGTARAGDDGFLPPETYLIGHRLHELFVEDVDGDGKLDLLGVGYGTANQPSKIFNKAALKAVSQWKYNPKIEDGKAVEQHGIRIAIPFVLGGDNSG